MSFLEVKNIQKSYPKTEKPALQGLAFSMEQGEIISFVGPSGSGKSTLLKLLGGIISLDSGEILFKGKHLAKPEDQLIAGEKGIKVVFQDLKLMPNHTVEENVKYPLMIYNQEYQKERADELLNLCGLIGLRKRFPRELSGGQQQRLALAKTLAEDPELLLMDEPFSNLDPMVKKELIQEVTEIVKNQGLSLILVTHDTQDALMISDRVGMIQDGKLVQFDTPKNIYNQPKSLSIASFFGTVNAFSPAEFKLVFGQAYPKKIKGAELLCVRAEAILIQPIKDGFTIKADSITEHFLGHSVLVNIKSSGKNIEAKIPFTAKKGEIGQFHISIKSIMELLPQ